MEFCKNKKETKMSVQYQAEVKGIPTKCMDTDTDKVATEAVCGKDCKLVKDAKGTCVLKKGRCMATEGPLKGKTHPEDVKTCLNDCKDKNGKKIPVCEFIPSKAEVK